MDIFETLRTELGSIRKAWPIGRVNGVSRGLIRVRGLADSAALGDRVRLGPDMILGEVVALESEDVSVMADAGGVGLALGAEVQLDGPPRIFPSSAWIGRVVDPLGQPMDGRPLFRGRVARPVYSRPPPAAQRRSFGERLPTGSACFDTFLPLVRGQRIGLFAGSGVGKSTLIGRFAKGVRADVVVIALVGERGRELRDFTENILGEEGLARSVIVAATSDNSPLLRRLCLPAAMTVAEYFRDQGLEVLLLADSVTRFAEAHREIALSAGEPPALQGFPPSVQAAIMSLAERAGPGGPGQGSITAVFSVLVAGSDMEGAVADILRGVLDGHVVLDRKIAERGRFPAIDLLRSVSRSLPGAASAAENHSISEARRLLSAWENAELMVQSGLYQAGSDPLVDEAIQIWPALDRFLSAPAPDGTVEGSFAALRDILSRHQNRNG